MMLLAAAVGRSGGDSSIMVVVADFVCAGYVGVKYTKLKIANRERIAKDKSYTLTIAIIGYAFIK